MKIKINSLLVERDNRIAETIGSDNAFRVKDLTFNVEPCTLEKDDNDSDILKCIKYFIKENKNKIDYYKSSELINTGNIIGNNFWNNKYFESACKFEYRDYFDLDNCEIIYKSV